MTPTNSLGCTTGLKVLMLKEALVNKGHTGDTVGLDTPNKMLTLATNNPMLPRQVVPLGLMLLPHPVIPLMVAMATHPQGQYI